MMITHNTLSNHDEETIRPSATRKPISDNNQRRFWSGMTKLILMSAIVVLVAGGSAQAQHKPIVIIGPPVPFDQVLNLEDDVTGSFLVFNTRSGEYKFTRCNDGFTISGVGFVKVDGCSISLEDVQADHRVVASVNECAREGKAIVEKFASVSKIPNIDPVDVTPFDGLPFKLFLSDQNMGNNLMDCAPKK